MPYQSVNPATGELLQVFQEHTDQQMLDALAAADKTYREVWSTTPYKERAKYIARAAALMLEQKEDLSRFATIEMGKRIAESRGEVEISAAILKYYADNAEKFLAPRELNSVMGDAHIEYSPIGVLIGIQPWNYPYYQLTRFAAPNLMSGNVILLKHAPGVPQCALAFERILNEAGLPAGAYTNLFLSNEQVSVLLSPENAAAEIDRLILTSWRRKLPVYMELPSDVAYLEIEVPDEPLQLTMPPGDKECLQACRQAILERLRAAKSPAFLLDLDADRFGVAKQITELAERWQMRVAAINTCKGVFRETSPLYVGIYSGIASAPATRDAIEQSDCLLTVGYRRIESTSGFFTDKLPESAIRVNSDYVDVGTENYQGVNIAELMDALLQSYPTSPKAKLEPPISRPSSVAESTGPLTQTPYWNAMQEFIRPGDVIIAEDGTSIIGAGQMTLPQGCTFISQAVWDPSATPLAHCWERFLQRRVDAMCCSPAKARSNLLHRRFRRFCATTCDRSFSS